MPTGGERQEFIVKPMNMLSIDMEPIEDVGGETWHNWASFLRALMDEKTKAFRALIWRQLKIAKPELSFAEVVIGSDEFTYGPDDDEILAARERAASEDTPDAERVQILAMLGDLGKEPSENSDDDTSSDSPEPDSTA